MRDSHCKTYIALFVLLLSACATDSPQVNPSRFKEKPQPSSTPLPVYPDLKPPQSIEESFIWTEDLMREFSLASQRASNVKPHVATALATFGTLGLLREAVDPEPRMTRGLAALGLGAYVYGSSTPWETRVQVYSTAIKALDCRLDLARPYLTDPASAGGSKPNHVLVEAHDQLAKVYSALIPVQALNAETVVPASTRVPADKQACAAASQPCTPPLGAGKNDPFMGRCLAAKKALELRCRGTMTAERRSYPDPLIGQAIAAATTHIDQVQKATLALETRLEDSYQAGLWLWIETHWVKGQADQDLANAGPDLDSIMEKLALKIKPPPSQPVTESTKPDVGALHSGTIEVPRAAGKEIKSLSMDDREKLNTLDSAVLNSRKQFAKVNALLARYQSRPKPETLNSGTCPMPRAKTLPTAPAASSNRPIGTIPPDSVDDKLWMALGLNPQQKDFPEFARRVKLCKTEGLKLPGVADSDITDAIQQRIVNGECKAVKYS